MKYIILFVIALILIGPIATIWALNTLFPVLNIPLTFETWVAVIILGSTIGGNAINRATS